MSDVVVVTNDQRCITLAALGVLIAQPHCPMAFLFYSKDSVIAVTPAQVLAPALLGS
jgi:hypothetical protein